MIDVSLFSFATKSIQNIKTNLIQASTDPLGVEGLVDGVNEYVINPLIAFLFSAGLILFFYGIVMFLRNREANPEKSNEGRRHMVWGIIGMFIMASVFGILNTIVKTFQFDNVLITPGVDQSTATSGGAGSTSGTTGGNQNGEGGLPVGEAGNQNGTLPPTTVVGDQNDQVQNDEKGPDITILGSNQKNASTGDEYLVVVVFITDGTAITNTLSEGEVIFGGVDNQEIVFSIIPSSDQSQNQFNFTFEKPLLPGQNIDVTINEGAVSDPFNNVNKEVRDTIRGSQL